MQVDMSDIDQLQSVHKAALGEWIAAIKQEEELAPVNHSVADVDKWEAAHFKEDDVRGKALPSNLKIATAPKDVDVQNEVGFYTARYEKEDDRLVVHRRLVLKARELKAADNMDLERLIYAAQNDFTAIVTTSTTQTEAQPAHVDVDMGKSHS